MNITQQYQRLSPYRQEADMEKIPADRRRIKLDEAAGTNASDAETYFKVAETQSTWEAPELDEGLLQKAVYFDFGDASSETASMLYDLNSMTDGHVSHLVTQVTNTFRWKYDGEVKSRSTQEMADILEERLASIEGNAEYTEEMKAFVREVWETGFVEGVRWGANDKATVASGGQRMDTYAFEKYMREEVKGMADLKCSESTRALIGKGVVKFMNNNLLVFSGFHAEMRARMSADPGFTARDEINNFKSFSAEYHRTVASLKTMMASVGGFSADSLENATKTLEEERLSAIKDSNKDPYDELLELLNAPKVASMYRESEENYKMMRFTGM